jgi:hypothetical protein
MELDLRTSDEKLMDRQTTALLTDAVAAAATTGGQARTGSPCNFRHDLWAGMPAGWPASASAPGQLRGAILEPAWRSHHPGRPRQGGGDARVPGAALQGSADQQWPRFTICKPDPVLGEQLLLPGRTDYVAPQARSTSARRAPPRSGPSCSSSPPWPPSTA